MLEKIRKVTAICAVGIMSEWLKKHQEAEAMTEEQFNYQCSLVEMGIMYAMARYEEINSMVANELENESPNEC